MVDCSLFLKSSAVGATFSAWVGQYDYGVENNDWNQWKFQAVSVQLYSVKQ